LKIIVRLLGGIGNQLFQYAAGRSLATKEDCELILDDSLMIRRPWMTPRDYALDVYNIQARRISLKEKASLLFRVLPPFRYLYETGLANSPFTYYREPHYHFDPGLHQLTGDLIIEGYWQSGRYFADIADDLRRELQPIRPLDIHAQNFLDQILNGNSVSLHIRRGDYISNPAAAKNFFTCDLAYYQRAVAFVGERVANVVFFVFTDDPYWVEKEFRIDFPMVLVSRPNAWPAHDDLRLMSHCSQHIIANSSFSWWGAWLNPRPDKVVVAPSRWFREKRNMRDLISPEWNII
jgi:hypothetical protein